MADLATSAVVVNAIWKEGGTNSRRFLAKDVTLTLTGQGTTTNKISASLFGMRSIVSVRDARTSANEILNAVPSYDGSVILLSASELDASGDAETLSLIDPDDFTGTVRLTVLGLD